MRRRHSLVTARRAAGIGAVLVSASAVALAQTVPGCGWLVLIALVPVCILIDFRRFLGAWATLTVLYALYTMASIYWIHVYRNGSLIALAIPCVLYTGIFFFFPALCCWAIRSSDSPAAELLILPSAWAITEIIARHVLLRVSWALVGQPLVEWPILAQGAAIGGPEFLSFLAVATSVAIALGCRKCTRNVRIMGLLQGPGLLLVMVIWGAVRLNAETQPGARLRVAVIQPNLAPDRLWDLDNRASVMAHFDRLIDQAIDQEPDLVVLPESAAPGFVAYSEVLAAWVQNTVLRCRCPLLFGSLDRTGSTYYNIAMMITNLGNVTTYRKQRLVPVTEYVPEIGPLKEWIGALRGDPEGLTPGTDHTLFRLPEGTAFGTMICYEDIFPDLACEFVAAGAQFLVSIVNTAEFKDSSMAWQHLRRAQLTGISVGSALVRCSNGGISCLIDSKGRIVDSIRSEQGKLLMVEGARVFSVPIQGLDTPFKRLGDSLPLTLFGATIVGSFGMRRLRMSTK
jgi:apolipoprotein N-acyltransferase